VSTGELVHTLSFYVFGVLAIVSSILAVVSRRILRAAVALAVTLVCGAVFYILLNYDFIAAIQVLVYVGGIVVLIVYAIMLTSSAEMVESRPTLIRKVTAIGAACFFPVISVAALIKTEFAMGTSPEAPANIAAGLGRLILSGDATGYVLAFEVISLLLLAAVIGAIVIARSHKAQVPGMESGGNVK
jgi:NADH-quinone oxidoreductase subunit J